MRPLARSHHHDAPPPHPTKIATRAQNGTNLDFAMDRTATVTYRHEETIRLISVRRARDSEKAQYLDAQAQRR
jgi:hypothetical protein